MDYDPDQDDSNLTRGCVTGCEAELHAPGYAMNGAQLSAWESTLPQWAADLEPIYDEALIRLRRDVLTDQDRHAAATTVVDAIVDGWASADFVREEEHPLDSPI